MPKTLIQVMSETTSNALLKVVGLEAEGTAELLSLVDQLFDCLNVHNLDEAKRKRKPFRSPYRCGTDWRLKVCMLTWLRFLCSSLLIVVHACIVAQGNLLGVFPQMEGECDDHQAAKVLQS